MKTYKVIRRLPLINECYIQAENEDEALEIADSLPEHDWDDVADELFQFDDDIYEIEEIENE